jgi:hypothetical protein
MKYIFALVTIVMLASCTNDAKQDAAKKKLDSLQKKAAADTVNYTTVQWLDTIVNFGTVKQGEVVKIEFHCKNTGTKPLILTNVRPGCGCTIADYTKEPITPGNTGVVTGSFDSKHFCGVVNKYIMASTNSAGGEKTLQFTGTITGCESNDKIAVPHTTNKN